MCVDVNIVFQRYMIDEIIRGLVSTPMEDLDQFITGEITNHLFEERRIPHSGMDLPALNVQRGKVSSYVKAVIKLVKKIYQFDILFRSVICV